MYKYHLIYIPYIAEISPCQCLISIPIDSPHAVRFQYHHQGHDANITNYPMATHALQEPIPAHLSIAEYLDKRFRLSALPTLEFDLARDDKFGPGLSRISTSERPLLEEDDEKEDLDVEYVTGWKLFGLMMSITLATFLVLLDMSIIVTVGFYLSSQHDERLV